MPRSLRNIQSYAEWMPQSSRSGWGNRLTKYPKLERKAALFVYLWQGDRVKPQSARSLKSFFSQGSVISVAIPVGFEINYRTQVPANPSSATIDFHGLDYD